MCFLKQRMWARVIINTDKFVVREEVCENIEWSVEILRGFTSLKVVKSLGWNEICPITFQ